MNLPRDMSLIYLWKRGLDLSPQRCIMSVSDFLKSGQETLAISSGSKGASFRQALMSLSSSS